MTGRVVKGQQLLVIVTIVVMIVKTLVVPGYLVKEQQLLVRTSVVKPVNLNMIALGLSKVVQEQQLHAIIFSMNQTVIVNMVVVGCNNMH